jgi:hypothetical protein
LAAPALRATAGSRQSRFVHHGIGQRQELIGGKNRQDPGRESADVARQQVVGARVKCAVELDGVLEVREIRVDCLIQDALVRSDAGKDIAQQDQYPASGGRVARLANDVEDIVEADCRDQCLAGPGLRQGPDAGGRRVEGLASCQDVEQQVGIEEDPHPASP